nr:putative ribonuclease H-like domain-containing protein [Tanacetum cinerariifolium]
MRLMMMQERKVLKFQERRMEIRIQQKKVTKMIKKRILNIVSSPVNTISSSFTTIDPGRERTQRNEFESMFRQDKDANNNRIFTLVNAAGSTYVYLGGSILVIAATLPNANLFINPLMPDLEDTTITRMFSEAYDDEVEGVEVDFTNLIEASRLFLAYASFMGFIVYQMDVKSAFLYGIIEEEVYVYQPLGFEDPYFPNKVYKVEKDLYGLHQAPRACKDSKHSIETNKALLKDKEVMDVDVDVYLYRSMIGSLMYLAAFRPDIMFDVSACLWYPRDLLFDLKAFSDSDYARASLDMKSITRGCQFLGKRLISWQCKKQTVVANSTTKAEYIVAANSRRQVLWIQNQMLDYGFNFMNTKIYIDNESTICIVKNP